MIAQRPFIIATLLFIAACYIFLESLACYSFAARVDPDNKIDQKQYLELSAKSNAPRAKIRKKVLLTLLNKDTVSVETSYNVDSGINTSVTSLGIHSMAELGNIEVKVNGNIITKENYYDVFLNDKSYRFIVLKKGLSQHANINNENDIYIKYVAKLPEQTGIQIDVTEVCQVSNPQVDVDFILAAQSKDSKYAPVVISNQRDFLIRHFRDKVVSLSRRYISYDSKDENKYLMPIKGLLYQDVNQFNPREVTRSIDIFEDLIKDNLSFKLKPEKGRIPYMLFFYQLPKQIIQTDIPMIEVAIDGKKNTAHRIDLSELKEIFRKKSFSKSFYYWGRGLNSNENFIYLGFILDESSSASVNISAEYFAKAIVESKDKFHFAYNHELTFPSHMENFEEFLHIKIPNRFVVTKINYEDNCINKPYKGNNELRFRFKVNPDTRIQEPLRVEFYREGTRWFDFLKYINISLLCASLLIPFFWKKSKSLLTHKLPKFFLLTLLLPALIAVIKSIPADEYWLDAINYTWSWVSLLLFTILFTYKRYNEYRTEI